VAHRRATRRAGLRHGATLRLSGAAHQWARAGLAPSARGAARAEPAVSKRAAPASRRLAPGSGPDRQDGQRGCTTCKCGNSHGQEWPSRRAGWGRGGKSHGTDDRAICAGDRPTNAGSASRIRCPASSLTRGKMPGPNTRTAAQLAAVAVLSCCTRCSICSKKFYDQVELSGLEPLTSCMPSGGSTSTRVHPCRSPSLHVPARPPLSMHVAVLSCCTVQGAPVSIQRCTTDRLRPDYASLVGV